MITHARLLRLISYDPETGIFRLLIDTCHRKAGTIANRNLIRREKGKADQYIGYVFVPGGGRFQAGRLAWFYMKRRWPTEEIDHADNDGWNHRWENLRVATRSQNQANTRCYRSNKLGHKGVYQTNSGYFRAMIQKDNRRFSLGTFKTEDAAIAAYAAASVQLHGSFARP